MKYLFIYVLIVSCKNFQKKKDTPALNGVRQNQELLNVTCSLVTLDGTKEIYTINRDSIYFLDKKEKLSEDEIRIIKNYPKEIDEKNKKYGCGVCVDGVDFEFVFRFSKDSTTYSIRPGAEIPKEVQTFFEFLTQKYNESLLKD